MTTSGVSDVSDTARWVATYRARESARPDALFRDPYAERLAGARGAELTRLTPRQVRGGWPLVVRTKLIDDLLLQAVRQDGVDCVVNLGAGLDARPYRLELPASLTWLEVDFPGILEEKARALWGELPRCQLQRIPLDLQQEGARREIFAGLGAYQNVLVLSEGFAVYLEDDEVASLGRDLLAQPRVRYWLVDFFSPRVLEMMKRGVGTSMESAPFKFAPANGVAFFEALGWRTLEVRSIFGEASRLGRAPWLVRLAHLLPEPDIRRLGSTNWAAAVRFTRA